MTFTKKYLWKCAREELRRWKQDELPTGLVMAIIWAYVHYATTGDTIEETFFNQPKEPEYYI